MKVKAIYCVAAAALLMSGGFAVGAKDLVILHTNDTHSMIDPDAAGAGGVLQRKAIIDSVRKAEKNVLLVDAGDAVQGTLYFKFFRGDVEYPLMNMMDYDVQILGNHEFDNGLQDLASRYSKLKSSRISSNYDVSDTPLNGLLDPYAIKKVDGKKIGFLALNVDPTSLISKDNYAGLKFNDIIESANKTAAFLKDSKKCDVVVAVTHIGVKKDNDKTTDYELARASKDIDIIIGGHSHTVIPPENADNNCPSVVENAVGRPVLVAQTGKYGRYLGYIKIDLDDLKTDTPADYEYRLIPVTDRFPDSVLDERMKAFIKPYRERLRAVDAHVIGYCAADMNSDNPNGSYVNWTADFAYWYGNLKADSLRRSDPEFPQVDFSMMNVGGIRQSLKKGDVTEGKMLATFPFANHVVISKIKGSDFIEAMRVAARKGGEGVSESIRVTGDPDGENFRVVVNDGEMNSDEEYVFSTIDYLAGGNDDYTSLARGRVIWRDDVEMCAAVIRYVELLTSLGLPVDGDPRPRFINISGEIRAERP